MSQTILWTSPITDRSQNDVDRAKALYAMNFTDMTSAEQTEYLAGLKGALNHSDLLRIESNIQLLSDVLDINLTTYHESVPEFPTVAYYTTLLSNVSSIRSAYAIYTSTPSNPSAPLNTFAKWNDIEKILEDIYELLQSNFHYYAGGEIYAGDETGLLL